MASLEKSHDASQTNKIHPATDRLKGTESVILFSNGITEITETPPEVHQLNHHSAILSFTVIPASCHAALCANEAPTQLLSVSDKAVRRAVIIHLLPVKEKSACTF